MPQSKGTATWLTNVKQDAPLERVRLDNSRAKIENKRMDMNYEYTADALFLQQHRSKADMNFELRYDRLTANVLF